MGRRLLFLVLFVVLAVAAAFLLAPFVPAPSREATPTPQPRGGRVYFQPLGKVTRVSPEELAQHFRKKFGLQITVLPGLDLEPGTFNARRKQYTSEQVLAQLKRAHPGIWKDEASVLIGLTDADIYIEKYDWRFTYAYREDPFGVVSTAWMDPPRYGDPPDPELCRVRFRKMMTKYIGILYYRLPQSHNPKSVLFGRILGEQDLDVMTEEF